ncbi:DUF7344 domain-containing protein [Haloarchaeobius sp. HRN-SO-5]|uniref:DUF7344 domain-containing protein n=1 Tax=Haloarchaeobius sp. HRN-SO-5 TaxID=3446118 RepID=UPI003EBA5F37
MTGDSDGPLERSVRLRRVLELLDEGETPVTVDQLVDELVADVDRYSVGQGEEAVWEVLHEQLYGEDLPELDRAGLVSFEDDRGLVTRPEGTARRPGTSASSGGSSREDDGGRRVDPYYVGIAVLSILLLATMQFDVEPVARLPETTVSTTFLVLVSVLSFLIAVLR